MKVKNVSKAIFIGFLSTLVVSQVAFADVSGALTPFHNGTFGQLTPSVNGAKRSWMVDEQRCNGKIDYNFTNIVGAKDSYLIDLRSVPNGSIISGIDIVPCASENRGEGNLRSVMNVFYRFNGVNSPVAGNYALAGVDPVELASTRFLGLSFVKNNNSALEVGAVLSAGNRGMRLSNMAVAITYTPMSAPTELSGFMVGNQVILTWIDNSKTEEGFRIERYNPSVEDTFSVVGVVGANSQSYTDPNLGAGIYVYRVSAVHSGSSSEPAIGAVTVQ